MSEIKHVTVTALTKYIKRKFDADPHLKDIWVKGELSNFKMHSRGHMYFTLKDEGARIAAVMFASQNASLKFMPENGMKVLLRCEISVYEPSGNYQIYVKEMQPDGIGSLYLAYEELKKKLEKEGLFDERHKQQVPKYPSEIGVITSPTGAAVRDILTTIKRRYPSAKVIIIPALVQGINAGPSVVKAIRQANSLGTLDVIIAGRGGGSIEELWAFNEEIVAREIFSSKVPIISAVGHETDYTIADFVADLRAPTPTGAAELAVPHFADLLERTANKKTRLLRAMQEKLTAKKEQLAYYQKSYAFKYPKQLYQQKEQQLDVLVESLQKESIRNIQMKKERFAALSSRLLRVHPNEKISREKERHQQLVRKMTRDMSVLLKQKQAAFGAMTANLNALSPLKIMDRGYSIAYQDDNLVKSISQVKKGDGLHIHLQDGQVICQVTGVEERKSHE